jgi:hypothetical protein
MWRGESDFFLASAIPEQGFLLYREIIPFTYEASGLCVLILQTSSVFPALVCPGSAENGLLAIAFM